MSRLRMLAGVFSQDRCRMHSRETSPPQNAGVFRPVLLAVCLLLAGCSAWLTPATVRPDAQVPPTWPTYPPLVPGADVGADGAGWRSVIVDERLRQLVGLALANNRDLRIAALNIEKSRAQVGIRRGSLFPAIAATATGTHVRSPDDPPGSAGPARISHHYNAGLGFSSYELDVFGRLRSQMDEAQETWLQQVETRQAVQISLIAEVIGGYLTLAADRERLQLARDTWGSLRESYRLIERRHALGIASQLDLSAAAGEVEAARDDLAALSARVAQDENALAVLVGTSVPAALLPADGLLAAGPALREVPAGMSSAVLLRRPDLRADEHALRAANAAIGAARAAFFPGITLTASAGSASADLNRLFGGGSGVWNFVPQINLPIFSGGALQASLDAARVSRDIHVAAYEKDIQTAFREVADALAQRSGLNDRLSAQQARTEASARAYRLATVRYRSGIDSYLSLLVYQRTFYAAQQSLIGIRLAQQVNRATLFKVLGGGERE